MKKSVWKQIKIFWIIAGVLSLGWIVYSMQAKNVAPKLLQNRENVMVLDTTSYISFTPTENYKNILLFYPGAMVDPIAYVPLCRALSEKGIKTIVIKMPFRLASLGYKKPLELGLLNERNKTYILAGHSQGAKMAAEFVRENPGKINKLVLMASTHPKNYVLNDSNISVLKIFGEHDGIAKQEDILKNRSNLPLNTKYILIRGGNHSQFGCYGFQLGDRFASISGNKQQKIIFAIVLNFIQN